MRRDRIVRRVPTGALVSLLAVGAASAQPAPKAPAAASPMPLVVEYRLTAERLACLRKNPAVYRKVKREMLTIPVALCPNLPPNPIITQLVNEGPGAATRAPSEESTMLFLSKPQFECLLKARAAKGALYRFRPETCDLAVIR